MFTFLHIIESGMVERKPGFGNETRLALKGSQTFAFCYGEFVIFYFHFKRETIKGYFVI